MLLGNRRILFSNVGANEPSLSKTLIKTAGVGSRFDRQGKACVAWVWEGGVALPLTECSGSVPTGMQMKEPGMDIYCTTPEPANPEMQFRAGSLATSLSLGFSTALVYFFP